MPYGDRLFLSNALVFGWSRDCWKELISYILPPSNIYDSHLIGPNINFDL